MNQWFSTLFFASAAVSIACAQVKAAQGTPSSSGQKTVTEADPLADVPMDKVSYNLGRTFGKNMVDVGFTPLVNDYVEGMKSSLAAQPAKYKQEEMDEAIKKFKAALPSDDQLRRKKALKDGLAYRENNRKRKEVTETPSGLQYEVLRAADGPKPSITDIVKVHYHGTLVDGTVFDSSVVRNTPATFRLDGVIAGWTEGVLLMNKGSKYKFVIPHQLAYGEQGQGSVGPNQTLVFEVELLDIIAPPPVAPEAASAPDTVNVPPPGSPEPAAPAK